MAKNNNECYLRILFPINMALPMEKCDVQNFNREVLHVLLKKSWRSLKQKWAKKNDSIKDIFNHYLTLERHILFFYQSINVLLIINFKVYKS